MQRSLVQVNSIDVCFCHRLGVPVAIPHALSSAYGDWRANPTLSVIMISARPDKIPAPLLAFIGCLVEKPLNLPVLLEKISTLLSANEVSGKEVAADSQSRTNSSINPQKFSEVNSAGTHF